MPLARRRLASFLLALLGFAANPPHVLGGRLPSPQDAPETRRAESVAPGVEHVEIRRGDFEEGAASDRWIIHLLVLDPRRVRLESALALDEVAGAETTSSLAARFGAVAAVNGGYFRTSGIARGEPTGMYSIGGKILSEPNGPRMEAAGTNAGDAARIAFSEVDTRAWAVAEDGERREVDGINRPRGDGELILFTPEFHRTTLTPPGGVEAVVRADRAAEMKNGSGSRVIPGDGCVLSASGAARDWLLAHIRPGQRVKVEFETTSAPPLPFSPEWVIGGGPLLVRSGKTLGAEQSDAEGFAPDFGRGRHPRTALGIREDGTILLVTVDGRQPRISVGMTVAELGALMTRLGCRDAINLDGGGSTTMVVRGKVVNTPSDAAGERPVSDALLVRVR
jgi:hypothetical protein